MKHIVSVSLGSSKRNKSSKLHLLGEEFLVERIGTDGDMAAFAARFKELDGKVDALGVGGADVYLVVEDRTYAFREIEQIISVVENTPVLDGSGLKHTLERSAIAFLANEGIVDFANCRTLLVSGVDRFGMAQALAQRSRSVVFGDLLFGLGLPIPVRTYSGFVRLAKSLLPIVTNLPFKWFYPTGEKQDQRTPKHEKFFHEADLIAGDWHYIRRYMPERMDGKIVLTQTVRTADIELLRSAGVRMVVTTTPEVEGETFATNVMEGVLVSLLKAKGESPSVENYEKFLNLLGWKPNLIDFS